MAKDFTDYLVMVLDSGERVYHLEHARQIKGKLTFDHPIHHPIRRLKGSDDGIYPLNGHNYLLNLDRAYRINWSPWKKLVIRKPYWRNFYKPVIELIRSKKIGLLIYKEPEKKPLIEILDIIDCECSCGFKGKNMRGTKVHVKKARGGEHSLKNITKMRYEEPPKRSIEPMHISRIHQPSGVMKG